MKQPSQYSRRGFTLIELLVVIAIIAILASILFPVFARARENARKTSCLSNMKQLGLSMIQYTQDYDGFYPIAWDENFHANNRNWMQSIQPYTKSIQVFKCPSDSGTSPDWAGQPVSYAINSLYAFPSWPRYLLGVSPVVVNGCWIDDNNNCMNKNDSAIQRAANTIMIAEKHGDRIANWDWVDTGNASGTGMGAIIGGDPTTWHGSIGATAQVPNGTRAGAYPNGPEGGVTSKHMEMANFLFVDGHAKAMRPAATNPDPANRPQDNMWDGSRS